MCWKWTLSARSEETISTGTSKYSQLSRQPMLSNNICQDRLCIILLQYYIDNQSTMSHIIMFYFPLMLCKVKTTSFFSALTTTRYSAIFSHILLFKPACSRSLYPLSLHLNTGHPHLLLFSMLSLSISPLSFSEHVLPIAVYSLLPFFLGASAFQSLLIISPISHIPGYV